MVDKLPLQELAAPEGYFALGVPVYVRADQERIILNGQTFGVIPDEDDAPDLTVAEAKARGYIKADHSTPEGCSAVCASCDDSSEDDESDEEPQPYADGFAQGYQLGADAAMRWTERWYPSFETTKVETVNTYSSSDILDRVAEQLHINEGGTSESWENNGSLHRDAYRKSARLVFRAIHEAGLSIQ